MTPGDVVEELGLTCTQFPAQGPPHLPIHVAGNSVLQLDMKTGPAGSPSDTRAPDTTITCGQPLAIREERGQSQSGFMFREEPNSILSPKELRVTSTTHCWYLVLDYE
jgi:hypothetical protein